MSATGTKTTMTIYATHTSHLGLKHAITGSWLMMQSTELRALYTQELTIGPKGFEANDGHYERKVQKSIGKTSDSEGSNVWWREK